MSEIYQQLLVYAIALWRKRWYVVLIGWVVCVPAWIAILALPDRYESQARIYVDTDSLLAPLLRGISVEGNVGQQVDFMQRTLLSRPNLEKLMRMTDLDLTVKTQADKDELFKDLARRIQITQNQGRNLFSVSFTDKSPELAQRVVQSLLSIFVESNVGASRTDLEKARQFLDVQIAQYEKQLQASEARLAEFKKAHLDVLSRGAGNGGSFQQSLDQARQARADLQGQLDDAKSRLQSLKQQLETVPPVVQVDSSPSVYVAAGGKALPPALASIQRRIDDQEKTLDGLRVRYTEQHPDVILAKKQLADLQNQYAEAEKKLKSEGGDKADGMKPVKTTVPNVVYEQIKLRIVELQSTITTLTRRLEMADAEVKHYDELATTAPGVEAELTTLTRDYGVLRKNYDELIQRRESAKLADAVETTGEKIQFRIVDPPQIPSVPSGPPRLIFMSLALVGALGAGLAVAFLMSQLDDAFISLASLRESVGLPVLGSVSRILTPGERRIRVLRTASFAASIGTLIMTYGAIAFLLLRNTLFS
ncbi:MAG TPA: XrtA system polysaccharide chain length determinant [Stellaceae bacterium]|nr:XrtA system polysaccharide chain length determinant [Stellaceae bacterium]